MNQVALLSQTISEPAVALAAANQALQRLLAGNQRFVTGRSTAHQGSQARRVALAEREQPMALLVNCADSSVPPEIIFDQGLGDVAVVRVAGPLANDSAVLGSIESAVSAQGSPLVVVLGHSQSQIVAAAVQHVLHGSQPRGYFGSVVDAIRPAVEHVKGQPGDIIDNAGKANVQLMVWQLQNAQPLLASLSQSGQLKIVGAWYDALTGKVDLIV